MIEKVFEYFKSKNVRCKIIRDDRPEYGDFIAVFGYGDITRQQIIEKIKENDLSVMFFEGSIREDNFKKSTCSKLKFSGVFEELGSGILQFVPDYRETATYFTPEDIISIKKSECRRIQEIVGKEE